MHALIATVLPVVLLALSMSTDAFAAAVGKGARLDRPGLGEALRTGLIFGSVEAATPLVGGKMIWDAARREPEEERPKSHSLPVLVLTAIGTSIDALAVGVTLALIGANIVINALAIGTTTFVLVTIGMLTGRFLGEKFGHYAEAAGGIVLILIGIAILAEHTLG